MAGPITRGQLDLHDATAVAEYQAFAMRVLISAAKHVPVATIAREEGCDRKTIYATLARYHKEDAGDRLAAEREIMLEELEMAARAWWPAVAVDPNDPEVHPSKTATEMWLGIIKAKRAILGADAAQKHVHEVSGEVEHRVYPALDAMEKYMQMADRVAEQGYGSGRASSEPSALEQGQGRAVEILDEVVDAEIVEPVDGAA